MPLYDPAFFDPAFFDTEAAVTFTQPPFWASNWSQATAPHAVSVRVTPAVPIVSSSIATATVLTTLTPHNFVSGDTCLVAGHTGSTPAVDGSRVVTVLTPTTVSIPLTVTVAGAGGTITRTIPVEPLTLAEAKIYARLTGTDLDTILPGLITTARAQLQHDTGIVLLTDVYDVSFDNLPRDRTPIALPWRPVPSIASLTSVDTAGAANVLDATNYVLDPGSDTPIAARVGLSTAGAWPTDLRSFQPYVLRIVAGWSSIAAIPHPLIDALGFLVDAIVNKDAIARAMYEDVIAPYKLVCVA